MSSGRRSEEENFGFENPNYGNSGTGEGLNQIESAYEPVETCEGSSSGEEEELVEERSSSSSRVVKSRQRYAQLGVSEMGVGQPFPEMEQRFGAVDEEADYFKRRFGAADSSSFSTVGWESERPEEAVPEALYTYYADEEISSPSLGSERRLPRTAAANSMSVDYSAQDFRRNFAAIDQAARHGQAPGLGVKVRQEGDTTIRTEHRDPYSFYWQLDQQKPPSPPPPPRRDDTSDNAIEEETVQDALQVQSPDSHDSGIQVERDREYRKPSKPVRVLSERFEQIAAPKEEKRPLPPGWERHQDPRGYSYYWHVDSGTVQADPPPAVSFYPPLPPPKQEKAVPKVQKPAMRDNIVQVDQPPVVIERAVPAPAPPVIYQPQQPVIVERAFKQTTTKRRVENDVSDETEGMEGGNDIIRPVRFAVRSLGWTEISEEDLTPERSSRAVNRAIVDLSTGRNDLIDNVAKWGDGKELIMELDDHDLRLIDPDSNAVLHTQPIHHIRVWGVGRDNGRDFAYVARDRSSRRFMCHVFRCDTPARTIANTLRDICKRLMMERRPNTLPTSSSGGAAGDGVVSKSNQRRRYSREASFPTPMEEPKKVIRCHFLGVTQVPRATGIDILNEAVDRLVGQVRAERWILVDVSIAPSTITITEVGGNDIAECRVRYLSFLGIGRDVKHCAFIMHTSSENFMCYVFHVEPSAGAMAKTIEAACKLRYQKVIDAHGTPQNGNGKGWGDTIKDVFGSLTGRRSSRSSHQYPR